MEIPRGMQLKEGNKQDYVLKINRNIYGQKQAGRLWNQYLSKKLTTDVGFTKSKIDEGVFYRGRVMSFICRRFHPRSLTQKEIHDALKDIHQAGLNITMEGDVKAFLGINIQKKKDGKMVMPQPHLIKQIWEGLGMDLRTKPKKLPACSSKILKKHKESDEFDKSFHYRSLVGKLNSFEKGM